MAGWHHWLDGRESEWTLRVGDGQGGLACCDSWSRQQSDTTERLIWSDLIYPSLHGITFWRRKGKLTSPNGIQWAWQSAIWTTCRLVSVFTTMKCEDALKKGEVGDTLHTDSQECQFPHLKQELTWKLLIWCIRILNSFASECPLHSWRERRGKIWRMSPLEIWKAEDFLGGPVVGILLANAGDMGSNPGPGVLHTWGTARPIHHSYWVCAPRTSAKGDATSIRNPCVKTRE